MGNANSAVYGQNIATRFRYERRLKLLKQAVRAGLGRDSVVCDLGCGDGTWLRYISSEIERGVGIDLGWGGASDHWQGSEQNIELRKGDFLRDPLPPESFDLVTCLETLEHVTDQDAVLERMLNLLRPGGVAAVSVPIEHGPSVLGKEVAARLMRYKRAPDAHERWTWKEALLASVGDIRAVEAERTRNAARCHKGFDCRKTEQKFRALFSDVRRTGTPFPVTGRVLNVGVILVGTKPGVASDASASR